MDSDTTHALVVLQSEPASAYQAAKHLRLKADSSYLAEILLEAPQGLPKAQKLLTGICFAHNWKEVWAPASAPRIGNSQRAIIWFTAVVRRYIDQIRKHVQLRATLTHKALQGRWEDAQGILRQHQDALGPTMWSLRWRLLLAEEMSSISKIEMMMLLKGEEFSDASRAFGNFFTLAAEKTLPEDHFKVAIRSRLPTDDPAFYRFLEAFLLEEQSGEWKTWEMLRYAECLPLIDRYEFFLRIIAEAWASNQEDAVRLGRAATELASYCDDPCLDYFVDCINPNLPIRSDKDSDLLISAWDAYMASNYAESYSLSMKLGEQRPALMPSHELLVKSAMYLQNSEPLSNTNPLGLLRYHLRNVFSKNEHSEDSLSFLQRFGSRYRIFSLTAALRSLHAHHSSPDPDPQSHRLSSYRMAVHSPRNFEYGHSLRSNATYLARCKGAFSRSESVEFFYALTQGTSGAEIAGCNSIPHIRRVFFGGLAASRRNAYEEALQYLNEFLKLQENDRTNPLSPFAVEEARRALVDVYRFKGDAVEMQRVVVKTFLDRPQSVRRLPILRVFEACVENESEASRHIEFPIITYLACDNPHKVSIGLRRFMRELGVTRPRDFAAQAELDQRGLTALFLRVCTPEVLDSLPLLNSLDKVEDERLLLLAWVSQHAPAYARIAETEVLRLTQNAQLREALQTIEGARVVLNIPGLQEAEQERFSDAYFRYAAQRELGEAQTKKVLLDAIDNVGRGQTPFEIIRLEKGFGAFAGAFREIRDAFVSSPHFGIEACLSGRIRHGILIQHIRKPFVERKLAVSKDAPERQEIQRYWQQRLLVSTSNMSFEPVMAILFRLTERINSAAQEVKNVWVQSRTEDRNPKGMFDYYFDNNDLDTLLSRRFEDVASVDTFLENVFDILLDRTRDSLRAVRSRIETNLRPRLEQAIDQAIYEISIPIEGIDPLPLRNALTACRPETEQICRQMVRWFRGTDAALIGDVEFDLVARTAIGMVEQLNPDFRGKHQPEVKSFCRLRGRHFTALVHMLFFLLDNAIQHSDIPRKDFSSKVKIEAHPDQILMSVVNKMLSKESATAAADKIQKTVSELKIALDPATVVREGGSGFAKVIAAIRYEFRQENPTLEATSEDSSLDVSIKCPALNLTI